MIPDAAAHVLNVKHSALDTIEQKAFMPKPKLTAVRVPITLKSGKVTAGTRYKNLTPVPGPTTPSAGPATVPKLSAKKIAAEAETAFISQVAYSAEEASTHNADSERVLEDGLALTSDQIRTVRDGIRASQLRTKQYGDPDPRVQARVDCEGFYRANKDFPDEPHVITTGAVVVFSDEDNDLFSVVVSPVPIREAVEGDFDYVNQIAYSLSRYGVNVTDSDNGDGVDVDGGWASTAGAYQLALA